MCVCVCVCACVRIALLICKALSGLSVHSTNTINKFAKKRPSQALEIAADLEEARFDMRL